MLPYWVLFLLPMIGLLPAVHPRGRSLWLVGVLFTVVVGLRNNVGGDWFSYASHYEQVATMSFLEAVRHGDPGYFAVNWLVAQFDGGIYLVNLVSAALVLWGVIIFSRSQPQPWLSLLVATPYLIVVVAMGYTRQSVALGLGMIGLTRLARHRIAQFVFFVLVGALFHKSAVLLLPIGAVAASRRRVWTWVWVAVTTAAGAALLVLDSSEALWTSYVEADMQSEGGLIRVSMNAVPAVLVLIYGRRISSDAQEQQLWRWMAIFALCCVPLVFVSSTAVDRVALYFIPIQMYMFSRLHLLVPHPRARSAIVASVVVVFGAVLWVWLNYATHAAYWVPYDFMLL
jgi:EpsG family